METYFRSLEEGVKRAYSIALKARSRGFDPELEPEIPFAKDMAERVEGLVGPKGVAPRIRELVEEMSNEEAAIKIAGEIVKGKFGKFEDNEKTAEQALRTSLALITEGIVAAPLEGIVKVRIKKNSDGTNYLAIYFAGPIRSAGGSAQALAVLVGDAIRVGLGLNSYKPTDDEIERFVEEVDLYNTEAARLQYHPEPQDIRKAVKNIPVEITGEPTEKVEVSGYRNLERIETNSLRGGAVLVLAEGVLQKVGKILKYVNKLGFESWEWLGEFAASRVTDDSEEKDVKIEPSFKYIKELVAGRPVLSHPSEKGGFRLRYGRSRNSGFAAMSMHPATMVLTDDFIAIGTQLKTERPGKGTAVTPCDAIDGPIVRLKDGSVLRIESYSQALKIREDVDEILFMGDILVNYGDFLENNHILIPAGYCEEWWVQELEREKKSKYTEYLDIENIPDEEIAIRISEELGIPIHPRYTYFYHDLTLEEMKLLYDMLKKGEVRDEKLYIPLQEKHLLEFIGVPHRIEDGYIVLQEFKSLLYCFGLVNGNFEEAYSRVESTMELVNSFGIKVMEKAPSYIGLRMGRPEKAKERKMSPAVNVLFPIGRNGGKTREVEKATRKGKIKIEVVYRYCESCSKVGITTLCQRCGEPTVFKRKCQSCGYTGDISESTCPKCSSRLNMYSERDIDIKILYERAKARVGSSGREVVKGIIGMTSLYKIPEPIEKGLLRARHGVYVFKDGTIRFDSTDIPLTHFRPREVMVSLEILKMLGYDRDHKGEPLVDEEQIIELKPQDIILPLSGADYLLKVTKFIDELLVKLYGVEPYYRAEKKEDLVGHLVLGLAPHTSAAILGRIAGFSKANATYAHPYFHAAKRRNCFHPDEKIYVHGKGYISLRHLVSYCSEKSGDSFGTKILMPEDSIFVSAYNLSKRRIIKGEVKEVSIHISPDYLIYLKTHSGREIRVTPDHRFPVFFKNKIGEKHAMDMKVGELLISLNEVDKENSNILFDEIVERKTIPSDSSYVISLNVEPSHIVSVNNIFVYNCDGDEDGVFLLMDALLNFSKKFLPSTRGSTMDAPLVLTTHLDPSEVDHEAHNIDIVSKYPLEFYEATLRYVKPQEFENIIETVSSRLGTDEAYYNLGFTHDTSDINLAPLTSAYKTLGEMTEKLEKQLALGKKIRAVDEQDVARRVIETHFLPDLAGNLRAFSTQRVRCVKCNTKYRRIPLTGKCRRCGGKLVLTVSRGGVEKYLHITEDLIQRYSLESYLKQRVEILRMSIASLFDDESVEQKSLKDFFKTE